jgi:hypothetical protein
MSAGLYFFLDILMDTLTEFHNKWCDEAKAYTQATMQADEQSDDIGEAVVLYQRVATFNGCTSRVVSCVIFAIAPFFDHLLLDKRAYGGGGRGTRQCQTIQGLGPCTRWQIRDPPCCVINACGRKEAFESAFHHRIVREASHFHAWHNVGGWWIWIHSCADRSDFGGPLVDARLVCCNSQLTAKREVIR